MHRTTPTASALLLAVLAPHHLTAQAPTDGAPAVGAAAIQTSGRFAAPVRLHAGDALLGADRLYPSPMFHDVDGDGRLDIAVGDLRGIITIALQQAGDAGPRFGAESTLQAADGKDLDFDNW